MMFLFYFLWTISASPPSPYQEHQFGNNLINQPLFDSPLMPPGTWFSQIASNIPGWSCSPYCYRWRMPETCFNYSLSCSDLTWEHGIDLVDVTQYITLTQEVPLTSSNPHLIHVEWYPPFDAPIGKKWRIKVNSSVLAELTVNSSVYVPHPQQFLFEGKEGKLLLEIQMYGPMLDVFGVVLGNVTMYQLIPPLSQSQSSAVSQLILNDYTSALNSVPGGRVFSYTLMSFLSAFDRLQFYYYHKHNLTQHSQLLLSSVATLAQERGSLPESLLQGCQSGFCESIRDAYSNLLAVMDQQMQYSSAQFLEKNSKGIGFFANNLDFFLFELPGIIVIYLLFSLVFRALFNYRISKYIRKYAFSGMLILIVYEGNIEQFAFYFFSECRNLFSSCLTHKISRVFMLFFFWILMVSSIGGFVWFWAHYRKLAKYFLQDSKDVSSEAILLQSLERSVFPLVFGAVHALLLDNLFIQSIVLACIEVCYLCTKLLALKSTTTKSKFKGVMLGFASLLRLVLILTLYLYHSEGNPSVINLVHHDLVWLYLVCWGVETVHDLFLFVGDVLQATKTFCAVSAEDKKVERPRVKVSQPAKPKDLLTTRQIVISSQDGKVRKQQGLLKIKPKKDNPDMVLNSKTCNLIRFKQPQAVEQNRGNKPAHKTTVSSLAVPSHNTEPLKRDAQKRKRSLRESSKSEREGGRSEKESINAKREGARDERKLCVPRRGRAHLKSSCKLGGDGEMERSNNKSMSGVVRERQVKYEIKLKNKPYLKIQFYKMDRQGPLDTSKSDSNIKY